MEYLYVTEGQTRYDEFFLADDDGTPDTGKADGDFTKHVIKDGTGDQSTAGITISEPDASNNPGWYTVTINGSTGFLAATGHYSLGIYLTSDNTKQFGAIYEVGASNTYTATLADFTATASDGRVTDGANPIDGATVIIVDGSGDTVSELETDSNGLWGPVYLTETSTIYAQADGYTQETGTITVSGTSATGPGDDVALSTSTATNNLRASNLVAFASREAHDRDGDKSDTKLLEIVNEAVQTLFNRMETHYYYDAYEMLIEGDYSTGTLAVTNGSDSVTLTGGTWPTNTALGVLIIDSQIYEISSRDSGTAITLNTAYQGTTDASVSDWTWGRHSYTLPTDMGRFWKVKYGSSWPYGPDPVSYLTMMDLLHEVQSTQASAYRFCVAYGKLLLHPFPGDDKMVTLLYERRPAQMTNLSDTADVDEIHLPVLRAAIRYHVACAYGFTEGSLTYQDAENIMGKAIAEASSHDRDKAPSRPPLRAMYGRRGGRIGHVEVPDS